jgi:hypothetical protein
MKTCDVCGLDFEIIEHAPNNLGTIGIANIKFEQNLITIDSTLPEKMKDSCLIHEWIHGVLDMNGYHDQDENMVSALQNALYRAGFRVPVKEA